MRDPEAARAASRRWYAKNKEYVAAKDKKRREANQEKLRTQGAAWRAANPEKVFGHNREGRARRYGLTLAEVFELHTAQGGKCAACLDPIPAEGRGSHIDHDHATGKVRGLLCRHCNLALGHAKERADRLRALINYLESTS